MEQVYFVADHHFGHKKIVEYANRPFSSLEDMEEHFIAEWNRVIPTNHTKVYVLGDFALARKPEERKRIGEIVRQLKGNLVFLQGNHDEPETIKQCYGSKEPTTGLVRAGNAYQRITVRHNKQKIILDHYRIFSWEGIRKGTWHLHGHHHGVLPAIGKCLDVGVDNLASLGFGYRPISFSDVKDLMDKQPVYDPESILPLVLKGKTPTNL